MNCVKCNAELKEGTKFCASCGAPQETAPASEQPAAPAAPAPEQSAAPAAPAPEQPAAPAAPAPAAFRCWKCNAEIQLGTAFCNRCGAPLTAGYVPSRDAAAPEEPKGFNFAALSIVIAIFAILLPLLASVMVGLSLSGALSGDVGRIFMDKDFDGIVKAVTILLALGGFIFGIVAAAKRRMAGIVGIILALVAPIFLIDDVRGEIVKFTFENTSSGGSRSYGRPSVSSSNTSSSSSSYSNSNRGSSSSKSVRKGNKVKRNNRKRYR